MIVAAAEKNDRSILFQDPHGEAAWDVLALLLERGMEDRIIFDELSYNERVLGYDFFPRSTHDDPLARANQNQIRLDAFTDILYRSREDKTVGVLTGQWLKNSAGLWLNQSEPLPLSWLPDTLRIHTREFQYMLERCTDRTILKEFTDLLGVGSPKVIAEMLYPTKRLYDPLFSSPPFLARISVPAFDLTQAILDKKIIIQCAGGEVADTAVTQIMGSTSVNVKRLAQAYYGRTQQELPIEIYVDEANSFNLAGNTEKKIWPQSIKWGVTDRLIVQHLTFEPDVITALLQNFADQYYFPQSSAEAAELAAEQLAIAALDHDRVLSIDERERVIVDQYEAEETKTTSESHGHDGETRTSVTKGHTYRPKPRKVTDVTKRYESLSDQILMKQSEIMRLKVGHMHFKKTVGHETFVSEKPEPVVMLEAPCLTKDDIQAALQRIRSQPIYQKPDLNRGNLDTRQAKGDAADRL